LHRFRNHYEVKNINITGEAASANTNSAARFPAYLKELIERKVYLPEQVFNCGKTGLFWKRMPNRTNSETVKADKRLQVME
jgi:hypothetical protein